MRKLFLVAVVLGSLSLGGCSLSKMAQMATDQQLTVTPNPLEVHADSVNFDISATLPVKMLKKGKVYTLNTYYKYGNSELDLGGIEFVADQYPNAATTAPTISKSFSFPYSDAALDQGQIEVKGVASDPRNGKFKESDRLPIADGLITTSQLVEDVYYAAYADHGYNNQEELIPTNIGFYFDQGRSNLKYSERRSDRGKEFEAFIADKNVTRTVTITGTHSPEGSERINSDLSKNRAEVIEKYYRAQMDKYDYNETADEIRFILKPVVEDWAAFKAALAEYEGISADAKGEMLNIVNGPGSFENKEDALQKVNGYKKVFKDVYPGLRAAKSAILTVKEKKTDAEISVLAKQITDGAVSADTLSFEELMYAGILTPSLEEKEAIYTAATKKGGNWNAHNNLGAVYVAMGMESGDIAKYGDMAETQLDIAANKQESSEVYANLASVYVMQGNSAKAADAVNKAASLSPSNDVSAGIKGIDGAIGIQNAQYDASVSALSSSAQTADNLFNKGLAYLLKKDYSNAVNAFGEAIEMEADHAMSHYGTAIAYARQNNEAKAAESIAKAVSADSALKEKAVSDLEFKNYQATGAFADALK